MYTKEDVLKYAYEYFIGQGYQLSPQGQVSRGEETYQVLALATVASGSTTSMLGKAYKKNQIKGLMGIALFDALACKDQSILFMPDTKLYRKQFSAIKEGIKALDIKCFFISETGLITCVEE